MFRFALIFISFNQNFSHAHFYTHRALQYTKEKKNEKQTRGGEDFARELVCIYVPVKTRKERERRRFDKHPDTRKTEKNIFKKILLVCIKTERKRQTTIMLIFLTIRKFQRISFSWGFRSLLSFCSFFVSGLKYHRLQF